MILKLQHVSVFYIKPSSGSKFVTINLLFVYSCYLSMLAACHIVRVMGSDFLLPAQGRAGNKKSDPITRTI